MNKSCFVEAYVYKGTKVYNVFDFTGYLHAFFKIFKLKNALLHNWGRISVTRIAVWLLQFFYNVAHGCYTNVVFSGNFVNLAGRNRLTCLNHWKNFAGCIVIFGVNPGVIKRVGTFGNFKEACTLFKSFWSKPRNFFKIFAACNLAVCIAVGNNFFSCSCVDT